MAHILYLSRCVSIGWYAHIRRRFALCEEREGYDGGQDGQDAQTDGVGDDPDLSAGEVVPPGGDFQMFGLPTAECLCERQLAEHYTSSQLEIGTRGKEPQGLILGLNPISNVQIEEEQISTAIFQNRAISIPIQFECQSMR